MNQKVEIINKYKYNVKMYFIIFFLRVLKIYFFFFVFFKGSIVVYILNTKIKGPLFLKIDIQLIFPRYK